MLVMFRFKIWNTPSPEAVMSKVSCYFCIWMHMTYEFIIYMNSYLSKLMQSFLSLTHYTFTNSILEGYMDFSMLVMFRLKMWNALSPEAVLSKVSCYFCIWIHITHEFILFMNSYVSNLMQSFLSLTHYTFNIWWGTDAMASKDTQRRLIIDNKQSAGVIVHPRTLRWCIDEQHWWIKQQRIFNGNVNSFWPSS
jgi:hypothetical protein